MSSNDLDNKSVLSNRIIEKKLREKNPYQFLFNNITIAIHETELNNVDKKLNEIRQTGVTDIEQYIDENPNFAKELFSSSKTFDVNQAMIDLLEAPSKIFYLENFTKAYASLRIDFFKKIVKMLYNGENHLKLEQQIETFNKSIKWVEISVNYFKLDDRELLTYLMKDITEQKQKDTAIQLINDRLNKSKTGDHLDNLVLALAEAFKLPYVFISQADSNLERAITLSISLNYQIVPNESYHLKNSPDFNIYQNNEPYIVQHDLKTLYPKNLDIQNWKAESYMGFPILAPDGEILGNFSFSDTKPITQFKLIQEVMALYVSSAAAEIAHRQNVAKIAEQNYTLDLFIDSTRDVFYVIDNSFKVLAFNKAAEAIFKNYFGVNLKLGSSMVRGDHTIPSGMFERHLHFYHAAFRGKYNTFTEEFPSPQGTFYFAMTFSPIRKNENEIVGCTVISKNITKSHRAEQKLRFEEGRYKLLFEHVSDSIIIYDLKLGKRVHCNQPFLDLVGIDYETFLELDTSNIVPQIQENGTDSLQALAEINKAAVERGNTQGEFQFLSPKNELIYTIYEGVTFKFGEEHLLITLFKNITELKKREDTIKLQLTELDTKNEELEKYIESNLQLENFAYIASHDMKTPIRTMVSFSQLLKRKLKSQLDESSQEYLNFIISASKNMQQLIDDLLLFSRVNTNERNFSTIDLKNILNTIQYEISTTIEENNGKIYLENMPDIIRGDATNIKQLFQNLMTNALKFYKEGKFPNIWIKAVDQKTHWLFSVKDDGIGISEEFHEKIFLIFKKLHHQSEYEGTGIGLSICKKIVEQHEGKIWLESTSGKGTTFFFTISKEL